MLVAVAQRADYELPQDRAEPSGQSRSCFDEVALPVVLSGQEWRGVGVGGQRLVVLDVVPLAGGPGLGVEGGVVVVGGAFLAGAGGDEPV